jgi:hypothetical protein
MSASTRTGSRSRAVRKLAVAAVVIFVVLFVVAAVAAVALNGGTGGGTTSPTAGATAAGGAPTADPTSGTGSWDSATEQRIAGQVMPQFPVTAAQPHELATTSGGPPLLIPAATVTSGAVPTGFPRTPQGALAQLKALNEAGMAGMDPSTYATAYTAVAAPGAPDPATSILARVASGSRHKGALPDTGPVPGLSASYQVSAGLIKGSGDDGNFVVPCALGVLTVVTAKSSVRVAIGDCQAMRWIDGQWRMSPTAAPTLAPATWPGTTEAQTAGYVAVIPDA